MIATDPVLAWARELPIEALATLGALAAVLVVLALGVQLRALALARELATVEEELVDPATGLLPRSALAVRLGADLAWAENAGVPVCVAVLHVRGSRFEHAARVLRDAMRVEEHAFLIGEQQVAVEFWDADLEAAGRGVRRLGAELARAGHPVVEAGIVPAARGVGIDELLSAARRGMRPTDDPLPSGQVVDERGRPPGALRAWLGTLIGTLPWFAALAAATFTLWRLVPLAVEGGSTGDGDEPWRVLVAGVLVVAVAPLAAALLHVTAWNHGGGTVPRSRPRGRATSRTALAIALPLALLLAWCVLAPDAPQAWPVATGGALAVTSLVVLVLLQARQLVAMQHVPLALIAGAGLAITWGAVELATHPVLANAGRLVLAAALGALLARSIERASWVVGLSLLAAAVDVWSVVARSGVTNRLLESDSDDAQRAVDLLLFAGPVVDGAPIVAIGVSDLVFVALYLGWAHDWRVDVRLVAGVLAGCIGAAVLLGSAMDEVVPVIPMLAAGMVLLVAARSHALRRRIARR